MFINGIGIDVADAAGFRRNDRHRFIQEEHQHILITDGLDRSKNPILEIGIPPHVLIECARDSPAGATAHAGSTVLLPNPPNGTVGLLSALSYHQQTLDRVVGKLHELGRLSTEFQLLAAHPIEIEALAIGSETDLVADIEEMGTDHLAAAQVIATELPFVHFLILAFTQRLNQTLVAFNHLFLAHLHLRAIILRKLVIIIGVDCIGVLELRGLHLVGIIVMVS
ncbi:MAG: hypothetical protein BWY82_02829 [Verrucomicrobia bacterium ADurb.Bin474]|nr:MAG: hypothetical protein BWY82_02829 [Verrucomicrobia bacterium ADurb.Bin474]